VESEFQDGPVPPNFSIRRIEGTIFRWGLSPVADPHFFIVEIECGDKVVLFLLFRKEKGRFNDPIPY
jgi:hypothetical protein